MLGVEKQVPLHVSGPWMVGMVFGTMKIVVRGLKWTGGGAEMDEWVYIGWKRKINDAGLITSNIEGHYRYIKYVGEETVLYSTSDLLFLDYLIRTRNTFEEGVWK